ncbi:MAG: hypothetical protein ACYC28_06715 [Longimicrobiales bacterium]
MQTDAYSVDIYSVSSGQKLAEEVPLPSGARVVGGGQYLYVVTSQPPDGWTILRLSPKAGAVAAQSST